MTKGSGHMLFVADTTRERLSDPAGALELVGELEVRGRVQAVPVWTLAPAPEEPSPAQLLAAL
jgi:class 3 adenylate cyclase